MTVGIVIPCRNEAPWIAALLEALAVQDQLPDDVVVVDDGSTDGTAAVVEEWQRSRGGGARGLGGPMRVRVVAGPRKGVAAAVNTGITELSTDVIVRLDGHCRPERDYVRRAAALATAPGVGVSGGLWRIEPGGPTLESRGIAVAVGHLLGSGGAAYRRQPRATVERESPEGQAHAVDTVPFGCFRRALWEELDGFDDRLRANQDYDFNFRVRQRGLRVMLDPAITCSYYARPTLGALARQYGRYGWWKARMLTLHPRAIRWRQLVPALLVPGMFAAVSGSLLQAGPAWPIMLAGYPVAVLAGAVHAAASRRAWPAIAWIAGAFVVLQVTWSLGFWASMVSELQRSVLRAGTADWRSAP